MQSFYCHSYIKNRCKKSIQIAIICYSLFILSLITRSICCLCFFHFTERRLHSFGQARELSCSVTKKRFFGYQLWIFYNLFIFGFNYWYIIFRIYYPANIVYSLVPLGFNYSNFWSHSFIQTERIHNIQSTNHLQDIKKR